MKITELPEVLKCPYCLAEMELKTRMQTHIFKNLLGNHPPLKSYKHYFYNCDSCVFDFTTT
jgi:hypothetical protein